MLTVEFPSSTWGVFEEYQLVFEIAVPDCVVLQN